MTASLTDRPGENSLVDAVRRRTQRLLTNPSVVLLNPPGSRRYLRDFYCGSVSKADYYWQPVDLLVQSGFLRQSHDVSLIDAMVSRLDAPETLRRVREARPIAVLALTSFLSWREDRDFFAELKKAVDVKLALSGDLARFCSVELLARAPFVDAALLDFTSPDLAAWIDGRPLPPQAAVTRRENGGVASAGDPPGAVYRTPLPAHELFWRLDYPFPFALPRPYASILVAAHGCGYRCGFCNTGMARFAEREWANVEEELDWLAERRIAGLHVRDASFNFDRERVGLFCEKLLRSSRGMQWFCHARADGLDEATIALMARAGCRYAAFGIESGGQALLDRHKRGADLSRTVETLRACRRHGIETLGHFLIGLPGETAETLAATRRLLRAIPVDFAAVNVFQPRPGATLLGAEATVERAERSEPSFGAFGASPETPSLDELLRAQKRLYRLFYLRVSFLLRLVRRLAKADARRSYWRAGASLAREILRAPNRPGAPGGAS